MGLGGEQDEADEKVAVLEWLLGVAGGGIRSTGAASVGAIFDLPPDTAERLSHKSVVDGSRDDFILAVSNGLALGDGGQLTPKLHTHNGSFILIK